MPYKRRYRKKRSYRRKTFRRKRTYRRKFRRSYRRLSNAFPNSVTRYLNYQEEIALDPSTGTYASEVYRANGLYDPKVGIGGHQPYGFDSLVGQYKYWRVFASSITVTPIGTAVQDSTPCYFGVVLSDTSSGPSFADTAHFLEYMKKMGSKVYTSGSFTAQNSAISRSVNKKFSYRKWFKASPSAEFNWGLGGSSDPAGQAFFQVFSYSIFGNNPSAQAFRISIGYKVKFFNPILQPES